MSHRIGGRRPSAMAIAASMTVAVAMLVGALPTSSSAAGTGSRGARASRSGDTPETLPQPAAQLGWFGYNVAMSRNTAVSVAIHTMIPSGGGFAEEQGQAFIYARVGRSWSTTPVAILTAPVAFGQFGTALAVSDDTVVISDPNTTPETVYLYSKGSDGWPTTPTVTLTNPDTPSPPDLNDGFGEVMAISGNTLLVGSANLDSGDGVVYEYAEGGEGWPTTPTTTFTDPGASASNATNDGFGEDLTLSGQTALIGAYGSKGDGVPLVYEYTEGPDGWPAVPTERLPDPKPSNYCFGAAGMSLSGKTAMIGAGCDHAAPGVVYVYARSRQGWSKDPVVTLHDPASGPGDYFGTIEVVSGRTAVVGSWGFDDRRGRVYVYTEGRGGWRTTPTTTLKDPTSAVQDSFGFTLGLSGHTAIIGAPEADTNDATFEAGLAYLYKV